MAGIIILLWMNLKSCQMNSNFSNEVEDYVDYKDTVMYYKTKNGDLVAYNKALLISEKTLYMMSDSLKRLVEDLKMKSPDVIIITKPVVHLDTIVMQFTDTLPCDDFMASVGVDSTHYKIGIRVTKEFVSVDSVVIPNKQEIVVGYKKNGLFKKSEYIVAVKNSNPYVKIEGLETYSIKQKVPWYKKAIPFAVGIVGGIILQRSISN